MFLILILAVFGNLGQLQLKYDHCKSIQFKGEYCSIQKELSKNKPVEKFNFYK